MAKVVLITIGDGSSIASGPDVEVVQVTDTTSTKVEQQLQHQPAAQPE